MIEFEFTPVDLTQQNGADIPEEERIIISDEPCPVFDMEVPPSIIALLKEAKEKHSPILITNNDETKAVLFKDVNDIGCAISFNGIPFMKI